MVAYLKDVIMGFLELTGGKAATPAGDRLFDIWDKKDARPLEEERANAFHHTTAQVLLMVTRARWDIQMAVAFLTTRVKAPDEDNWEKLKCVVRYLNGTKYLKLTICGEDLGILKWYEDGSHNVHWDCKGHAGAMFTLGEGAVSSYLKKLKKTLGAPLRLSSWEQTYRLVWATLTTIASSAILDLWKFLSYHFTVKLPCYFGINRKLIKRPF
jgi:hypothetical protein